LLYEISKVVASNRYLEEILLMIVGLTAQLMGSKICSLMILDEGRQELVIKATQSLSDNYRSKKPIHVGESVSGRVVLSKQPMTVSDVTKEEGYQYPDIAREEGVKSLASIPMMVKDRVIGVLNCYTAEEHMFSPEELQDLLGVANQAAIAIENTRLLADKAEAFEQLESRKKVERAKGILITRHSLTEDQAYQLLRKQSMNKRKSLKEIAEAIIVSEEISN